jgi:hypothetical protein
LIGAGRVRDLSPHSASKTRGNALMRGRADLAAPANAFLAASSVAGTNVKSFECPLLLRSFGFFPLGLFCKIWRYCSPLLFLHRKTIELVDRRSPPCERALFVGIDGPSRAMGSETADARWEAKSVHDRRISCWPIFLGINTLQNGRCQGHFHKVRGRRRGGHGVIPDEFMIAQRSTRFDRTPFPAQPTRGRECSERVRGSRHHLGVLREPLTRRP